MKLSMVRIGRLAGVIALGLTLGIGTCASYAQAATGRDAAAATAQGGLFRDSEVSAATADESLAGEWLSRTTDTVYDFVRSGADSYNGLVVGHDCVDQPGDITDAAKGNGLYSGTEKTWSSFNPCTVAGTATNTIQISADGKTAKWDSGGCPDCGPQTWTRVAVPCTASAASGTKNGPTSAGNEASAPSAVRSATEYTNWVGYVAETSKECDFRSVTGRWVQPALVCPRTGKKPLEADFWVGLDGHKAENDPTPNSTVEQTGVEAQCIWYKGKYITRYRAWCETYPTRPIYTGGGFGKFSPLPGSLVTATVSFDKAKKDSYTLTLTATKNGKSHRASIQQACSNGYICKNMSAEWVAEKVGLYGLAPFRPWRLTGGYATTTNGKKQAVASWKPVQVDLESKGEILAYACNLRGASFTVMRSHC